MRKTAAIAGVTLALVISAGLLGWMLHSKIVRTRQPVVAPQEKVQSAPPAPLRGALQKARSAIAGTVTQDGVSYAGSHVTVGSQRDLSFQTTSTDADGHYEVNGLAAGRYTVHARVGSFTQTAHVEVEAGFVTTADFEFKSGSAVIEGYVMQNGKIVTDPQAIVLAKYMDAPAQNSQTLYVGREGYYLIRDAPAGRYRMIAQFHEPGTNRIVSALVPVEVGDGEHVRADINSGSGVIQGTVALPPNSQTLMVFLRDPSRTERFTMEDYPAEMFNQSMGRAECREDSGSFIIRDVPAGVYNLTAVCSHIRDDGQRELRQDAQMVAIKDGESLTVNLMLKFPGEEVPHFHPHD
jgi:hypothetical protein